MSINVIRYLHSVFQKRTTLFSEYKIDRFLKGIYGAVYCSFQCSRIHLSFVAATFPDNGDGQKCVQHLQGTRYLNAMHKKTPLLT